MYGVGLLVMMLNEQSRRLGDFVAGTAVVHDTLGSQPKLDWSSATRANVPVGPLARVTASELQLIETYLLRRFDLDAYVREETAGQIVHRIGEQIGVRPDPGQSADAFLESVARQVRDNARFR
jgi:hypothetical protein